MNRRRILTYLGAIVVILVVIALMIMGATDPVVTMSIIGWLMKSTLESGTPLVLAALGGMFSERSGVVNIGLEGIMLMGAFNATAFTMFTGDPWIGVLAGILSGGLLALAHALVCVKFKGDHIVSGTGVILFGAGFTTLMLDVIWDTTGISDPVRPLPTIALPEIADIPILGRALNNLSPIVYMMFMIAILSWFVLYRTPFGLRIRAAGEDPSTLDAAGVNVESIRIAGVVLSGLLTGLAGAYLSIGFGYPAFGKLMTNGRGFIGLAALIFGNWTPIGCLGAGLLFGFLLGLRSAIAVEPSLSWLRAYDNFVLMLPYILVVVALAGIRRSVPPKGIAVPYEKEVRA
ncbi:MAG: ABC transporter permease [Candidatus Thorarchaeota archaeon]|jgi:simple sugar transport system permease protein